MTKNSKRSAIMYLTGLFFLSLGVSFSIYADLGVSPVSSLAYALSLITGFSVGTFTFVTHFFYIGLQVLLTKVFDLKASVIQLTLAFLYSFFIDASFLFVRYLFPTPSSLLMQWVYLIISIFGVAIGLLAYTNANFPLMPYDELINAVSTHFRMPYGRARVTGDVSNVLLSIVISLIFLGSLGSVGIGTLVSAVAIGQLAGLLMNFFLKYA